MNTQELKQQIDKVLGNSIRCLLPSYWWKKLFYSLVDNIEILNTEITEQNSITNDAIKLLKPEVVKPFILESLVVFSRDFGGKSFEPNKIYYTTSAVYGIHIDFVSQPTNDVGTYTLHFTTAEHVVFPLVPSNWLWVNGEMPSLEPNTHYELSVVATKFGTDYIYKAVLTPFKSVE
jgi:hypothetical protein